MPGRITVFLIAAFWLAMMSLLFHEEVLPRWRASRNSEHMRADPRELEYDQPVYWRLTREGADVGHAVTWWEKDGDGIVYVGALRLREIPVVGAIGLGTEAVPLACNSRTYLDADWKLVSFTTDVTLGDGTDLAHVEGRTSGDRLDVTIRVGRFEQTLQFFYDPEAVWSGGLLPPDRYGRLHVGDTWTLKTVNPMRGSPELVRCEVLDERTEMWEGRPTKVFTVRQKTGNVATDAWVTADGKVLRQSLPFGWVTLVAERVPEEIGRSFFGEPLLRDGPASASLEHLEE